MCSGRPAEAQNTDQTAPQGENAPGDAKSEVRGEPRPGWPDRGMTREPVVKVLGTAVNDAGQKRSRHDKGHYRHEEVQESECADWTSGYARS